MRTSTLTTTLMAALVLVSASAGGALAATVSLQGQQSPTGTPGTDTNGTTVEAGNQNGPSITFNDQQSSGQSVRIQSVTIPQPGFIVIYDSSRSGNETDQIIGSFHLLGSGTFQNLPVPIDTPVNQSKSLTAVVHADTNGNGQFDYVSSNGTQDTPVTPQGERRIVDIAQITVQSDSGNGSGNANTTDIGTSPSGAAATTASGSGETSANGTSGNEAGGSNGGSGAFGPGFGLLVGVVALLAVALFAARRT